MSLKQKLYIGAISGFVGLVTLAGCYNHDSRFNSSDIEKLYQEGFDFKAADKYSYRFDADDVISLIENRISAEDANAYSTAFDYSYFSYLDRKKIGNKDVKAFIENGISAEDILKLNDKGLTLNQVLEYSESFTPIDLFPLIKSDINPEEANKYALLNNKYGVNISGFDIVKYKEEGFSFEQVSEQSKVNWLKRSIEK